MHNFALKMLSLKIALNHLEQQGSINQKTLILSDILQVGLSEKDLYQTIARLIKDKKISRVIGVGKKVIALKKHLSKNIPFQFYK